MKILHTFLINLLLLSAQIQSQTIHLSGNISAGSNPVHYASITFTEEGNSSNTFTALTDTAGNYQLDIITGIKENPIIPQTIELAQNYPNPFSSETQIPFKLNKQSDVSIKIYNVLGQEIRTFNIGLQTNGVHGIKWDGRNNFGNRVTPGIYFYQLQTEKEALVKKMIFIKNGTANNVLPVGKLSFNDRELIKEKINQLTLGTYAVQIENTDSTLPKILFVKLPNIMLQHDTTINFQVNKAEWKFLGLENERVIAIAIDPIDPNTIYAGTLYDYSAGINGKLFKSIDGGTTWDTLLIVGGYREILIDPSNHNIIYTVSGGITKSEDGGETWQPIVDGIRIDYERRVQSLAMNPKNTNALYAGTGGFYGGTMYKSYDGGLHWNEIGDDSLRDGVVSIAIDPIDTNNVYAGTAWSGILWKSTDAGVNWFRSGLGEIGVHDIFINPKEPAVIYVGVPWLGSYKTEDAGISWENFSQGLPTDCSVMKIKKGSASRLFLVGTFGDDGGIYEYSYLQNQWVRIGIDNLHVSYYYSDLEISSNPDKFYFGGHGGIYVMDLKK